MSLSADDRVQHKATVLREAFDPTHDIDSKNAIDRLLRVRSFSIGGDSWNRKGGHGQDLKSEERFNIGDFFATLICVRGTEAALAIAQCTDIYTFSGSTTLLSSTIRAFALIFALSAVRPSTLLEKFSEVGTLQVHWVFTAEFAAFESVKARKSSAPRPASARTSRCELVFTVPASLTIFSRLPRPSCTT